MYDNPIITKGRVISVTLVLFVIIGLGTLMSSCGTVPQDSVGFGVGGGQLDPSKSKVKTDMLKPGRHLLGIADNMWTFPSNKSLRFQDIDTTITTVDGKKLNLQGQMAFRFVGEKDPKLAKEFATGVGARRYGGHRPGEDNKGWENMLNQVVTPEITSVLKDQFGRVYCADFEPACRSIDPRTDIPAADPERVYTTVSENLQKAVTSKLGGNYLQDIRVRIARISLPKEVQDNVDQVTSEQAKTKAAEQGAKTAKAEAEAIRIKGKALRANKGLIALEVAKECRGGDKCTLVLDGSGNGVGTSVPTK